jgi:hypothetical protein
MHAYAKTRPAVRSLTLVSFLIVACGIAGMVTSFVYLASNHYFDLIAGAAGFVAGSIFVSGGLIAAALLVRGPAREDAVAPTRPMVDARRWLAHFDRNQERRPEPTWTAPITLAADVVQPLVHSLEQFQLGDGGGPAYLIAWDRERFLAGSDGMRELVDRWFKEEREHSRLLGAALVRFGGRQIDSHWSFVVFCWVRRVFGVRFELTVLLLTEIVSTVYYRLIRRHADDPALRSMCRLILRDEHGHVAFHRERLATAARHGQASHGPLWRVWFTTLGLSAATMLWINHASGLGPLGATTREFYREVWREIGRFVRGVRRDTQRND